MIVKRTKKKRPDIYIVKSESNPHFIGSRRYENEKPFTEFLKRVKKRQRGIGFPLVVALKGGHFKIVYNIASESTDGVTLYNDPDLIRDFFNSYFEQSNSLSKYYYGEFNTILDFAGGDMRGTLDRAYEMLGMRYDVEIIDLDKEEKDKEESVKEKEKCEKDIEEKNVDWEKPMHPFKYFAMNKNSDTKSSFVT